MAALGAMYHANCLVSLYNQADRANDNETEIDPDDISHGIVLAELLIFIDKSRNDKDVAPIFKLKDLAELYTDRLKQKGVN